MRKVILHGAEGGPVVVAGATDWQMRVFTHGGLPQLPGDAVTGDLAENTSKRVAASRSMPSERAIANLIRSGHKEDFAKKWVSALLSGGETEATALEMVREKTFPPNEAAMPEGFPRGGYQTPLDPETYLGLDRFFRNAWRRNGDGIVIDIREARRILANHVINIKRKAISAAYDARDIAMLTGEPEDVIDQSLVMLDLRYLGAKIMAAKMPEELKAIWHEIGQ